VTEPLPLLVDIARQSTLTQGLEVQSGGFEAVRGDIAQLGLEVGKIVTAVAALQQKVATLMSEDATVAAEAADIETQQGNISTALGSIQQLFAALQTEVSQGNLSQATLDALSKAQKDLDAVGATAQTDVTADTPSSTPVTGS